MTCSIILYNKIYVLDIISETKNYSDIIYGQIRHNILYPNLFINFTLILAFEILCNIFKQLVFI